MKPIRHAGPTRREAVQGIAGFAGLWLLPGGDAAQARGCLSGQTVRWLVGYSAGGGYDTYARLIEPALERVSGARIMIQNLPGAAGAIAVRTLADARPDGRTLGIFDGPGALWSAASGEHGAPDPERDLTILGRVSRLQHALVTGPRSGATTMEAFIALGRRRRLVFGTTAINSQNFVTCAVTARMFGLDVDYVSGYPGTRELILAVIRGEIDGLSLDLESGLDAFGPQGIIPLFTASRDPLVHPLFKGILRFGAGGEMDRRTAALFATNHDEAWALGEAVSAFVGFGRLIGAPPRLPAALAQCLEDAVWNALSDPALTAAAERAQRTLAIASAVDTRREIGATRAAVSRIQPVATEAARRVR